MSANLLKLHLTCSFLLDLIACMTHGESDHLNKLQSHWEHANLFLCREESLTLKITARKCAHQRPLKRCKGEDVMPRICYNTQRMWLTHIFNYPCHPKAEPQMCLCLWLKWLKWNSFPQTKTRKSFPHVNQVRRAPRSSPPCHFPQSPLAGARSNFWPRSGGDPPRVIVAS